MKARLFRLNNLGLPLISQAIGVLALAIIIGSVIIIYASRAEAAVGDLVASVSLPVAGNDVGIAFDGTRIYYNDHGGTSNLVSFEPNDPFGTKVEVIVRDGNGNSIDLDAMAYDVARDFIWAVQHGTQRIYQVDKNTGAATFKFDLTGKCTRCIGSFKDGLAFDVGDPTDPNDDTLWWSYDVDFEVFKVDLNGNVIESFDVRGADNVGGTGDDIHPDLSACGNSGIAVGGLNLYLGTNGCDSIIRVDKDTKRFVDVLATPQGRPEGLECDAATFSPTEVMWVRQLEDPNRVLAFEIEPNTCGLGGAPTDSDDDGLFDIWETAGIDIDGDGNIDIDLPAMGADPNKKDIFVEVDWMEDTNHSHKPGSRAIERIVQAFANAPVDGGKGINLHVDVGPDSTDFVTGQKWGSLSKGESLPHVDVLGQGSDLSAAINTLKSDHFLKHSGMVTGRERVFHYAIFAHQYLDPRSNQATCSSGISFGNGNQVFVVSLGCTGNGIGTENEQAGTLMHELGHNFGLNHGGDQGPDPNADEVNHKPNYLSVMNYSFQMSGLIINGNQGNFDYSRFDLPDLDEASLSQPNGLNGGLQIDNYGTKLYCGPNTIRGGSLIPGVDLSGYKIADSANGAIDWNCNILTIRSTVQHDVNNAGGDNQTLTSFNDWQNLAFKAGNIGQAGVVPPLPITPDDVLDAPIELTPQQDAQIQRIIEPRVRLSKTVTPDTVDAGEAVEYTIEMLNRDASDAQGVALTDTLPAGFNYLPGSTTGATTQEPIIDGQQLTWSGLAVPAESVLTLSFRVAASNIPGSYFNSVSGSSANGIVFPIADVARLTVNEVLAEPVIINEPLELTSLTTSYDPTPVQGYPGGVFAVNATWENIANPTNFSDVFAKVVILEGSGCPCAVLNANGGSGGVGADISLTESLAPGETMSKQFNVGLSQRATFDFFVDIWGVPDSP